MHKKASSTKNQGLLFSVFLLFSFYFIDSLAMTPKFEPLYSFGQKVEIPDSQLFHDGIGNHYGVISTGGSKGQGSIYKINPAGQYSHVYSLDGANGKVAPKLMFGNNKLYGWTINTSLAGAVSNAVIYQIDLNQAPGILKVLYRNIGNLDLNDLILGRNGKLYGVTKQDGDFYTSTEFKSVFSSWTLT